MKLNSSHIGCLLVAAVLAFSVVGCKKGPQRVTTIPGQAPGAIPEKSAAPIEPTPTPIKIDEGPKPAADMTGEKTASGIAATDKDFSKWAEDRETFAAQTVYFDFDKSIVKASELPKVQAVARQVKEMAGKAIRVEGHCDERGTEEYNRALGERRAQAVREALVQAGVAADMIDTISFGEDKPAVPGHDEAAWSKNRRGVFILLSPPAAGGN